MDTKTNKCYMLMYMRVPAPLASIEAQNFNLDKDVNATRDMTSPRCLRLQQRTQMKLGKEEHNYTYE